MVRQILSCKIFFGGWLKIFTFVITAGEPRASTWTWRATSVNDGTSKSLCKFSNNEFDTVVIMINPTLLVCEDTFVQF